jgi:2-polyprenyl-6-methoxyphenol hydroxylase-like FAD-dependent oxidoreductase
MIVGAGPTGLSLARQLARFGVDFVIVDEREGTTPHSKAIGVQARTLEIYDQIGIADRLIAEGWRADKARLIGGGQVRGEVDLSGMGTGMSPFPFVLVLEQGIHERIVYEDLKSVGRDVRWLTEMTGLTQTDEGVTAKVIAGGREDEIRAKYLVGCDGAHSPVRHALELKFEGSTFERLFYVADVQIDWEFPHDAIHVNLGDETLTAFFPMVGEKRWRLVGTFPEGHEKEASEILFDEIEQQVTQDTSLKFDITNVNWFSVYKVHSRAVERFSSGRCFLAGDAAHIHTPAGAQGMNTGIQDGYNLAWKLAQVIKHGASPALLETYNEERLPNARRLLNTTDRFFDFAASDEWLVSFLRKNVFPYVANFALSFDSIRHVVFPLVSQIGINYEKSSLSETRGGFAVKAGDRMPWFEIGGRSIYEYLRDPMFHLVVFSEGSADPAALRGSLTEKWAGRIDSHFFESNRDIYDRFGIDRPFFVIIRPDNYIGMISDDLSPDPIETYLKRFS